MPLNSAALRQALDQTPGADSDGLETVHSLLCRREAGAFQRAAKATAFAAEPLLVACTQEARLFLDLNAETVGAAAVEQRPIHFVNIRETGGWSRDASALRSRNSLASCVQATSSGSAANAVALAARWKAPASRLQSRL